MKKIFLTLIIVFSFVTNCVDASEIFVSESDNLQMKLDNATAGDIVYVEGTHPAINVNVQDIEIVSEHEPGQNAYVQSFDIREPNVTIRGFKTDYISIANMLGECDILDNVIIRNGVVLNIGANSNIIANNSITNCFKGVYISEAYYNTITNNTISNCDNGVFVIMGGSNNINNNEIHHNDVAINLASENSNNMIYSNKITNNTCGVKVGEFSYYNTIYNNYFCNVNNTLIEEKEQPNYWNINKTAGTNIIGGPYLRGNYWSIDCPTDTGYSVIASDSDGDYIADVPYKIDEVNYDYGALVRTVTPIYNNTSITPVNNTTVTPEPEIEDDSSSSSGSSHSSGGSVGGSPEPQENVASKAVTKAHISNANKNVVKFKYTNITGIEFNITRSYGRQPVIVEELKNKSILTVGVPSAEVVEYFNVWIASNSMINKANLKNATIYFKIQNNISDNYKISVFRYDEKWIPVTFGTINVDDNYTYYKAMPKEYGQFVICKEEINTPVVTGGVENNITNATNSDIITQKERIGFWKKFIMKIKNLFK